MNLAGELYIGRPEPSPLDFVSRHSHCIWRSGQATVLKDIPRVCDLRQAFLRTESLLVTDFLAALAFFTRVTDVVSDLAPTGKKIWLLISPPLFASSA